MMKFLFSIHRCHRKFVCTQKNKSLYCSAPGSKSQPKLQECIFATLRSYRCQPLQMHLHVICTCTHTHPRRQRNKKKKIADVKKDEKIVSEIQKTLMSFGVDPTCIDTEAIKSMPNIQAYGHLLKQASRDMLARGETPTLDKLKSM